MNHQIKLRLSQPRSVREGMSLADAKALIDSAPLLLNPIVQEEANQIQAKFHRAARMSTKPLMRNGMILLRINNRLLLNSPRRREFRTNFWS